MQTIESYGLTVFCEDCDHFTFTKIKNRLEKILKEKERDLQNVDFSGTAYHYIRLTEQILLSVCMQNNLITLGIYDTVEQRISSHCEFQTLSFLDENDLKVLSKRLDNLIRARGKDIINSPALKSAWKEYLEQRKTKGNPEEEMEYEER